MKGIYQTIFIFALALGFASSHALACNPGPGPGKGQTPKLGETEKTASFNHQEQYPVQIELLDSPLKKIAEKCGQQQLEIVSGYRDPAKNAAVGGAKGSQHMCGNAADISFCKGKDLAAMFKILAEAGCGGIGCYETWVQCDIGPKRQWGPCPGNRPPADDPKDDNKDSKQQPDSAYDNKSQPDSPSSAAGGGSPPGSSPTSPAQKSGPRDQAQYPLRQDKSQSHSIGMDDMRGPLTPHGGIVSSTDKNRKTENDPSTVTRHGDPVSLDSRFVSTGTAGTEASSVKRLPGPRAASGASTPGIGASGGSLGELGEKSGGASKGSGKSESEAINPGGGSRFGKGGSGSEGAAASDALASFNPNKDFASKLGASGSDLDAELKKIQEKDFAAMGGRGPASDDGTAGDGASLFERCHATYVRCLRGGCVTAGGAK